MTQLKDMTGLKKNNSPKYKNDFDNGFPTKLIGQTIGAVTVLELAKLIKK